jgi:hypothetical protein
MKKFNIIKILFLSIVLLISWGCNKPLEAIEPDLSFSEVAIPDNLKSTIPNNGRTSTEVEEIDVKVIASDGKGIIGKMRFTFPSGEENTLTKFELTSNILALTALTPEFWTDFSENNSNPNGRVTGIGSCLKDCNSQAKGAGRGACKAGCWLELAISAAVVVVAIIAIT